MIEKIKKVRIYFEDEDKIRLLSELQKNSIFMLKDVEIPENNTNDQRDLENAIEILEHKIKYRSLEVTPDGFMQNNDFLIPIAQDVVRTNNVVIENTNQLNELKKQTVLLDPFQFLEVKTKDLIESSYLSFFLGQISNKDVPKLEALANETDSSGELSGIKKFEYEPLSIVDNSTYFIIYGLKESIASFDKSILPASVKFYDLPESSVLVAEQVEELKKQQQKLEEEIEECNKRLEFAASSYLSQIEVYYDFLENQRIKQEIKPLNTEYFSYLDGYIVAKHYDNFTKMIKSTIENCSFEVLTLDEGEEYPTSAVSNKFSQSFDMITNSFSVPSYTGQDPNVFMSFWYLFCFGIMVADVGYGLVMLILFGGYLKLKKPIGTMKKFFTIFFYSGFSTIFFGILLGGFFGADFDLFGLLTNGAISSVLISPINNPMGMLIISLGIGVVHIMCGLCIHAYMCIKRKEYQLSLGKDFSWISIFIGIALFLLGSMVLKTDALMVPAIILIAVGVVLLLGFNGAGKKPLGRILGGFGGIYGATGYLSDILSYSRILALCLSGGQIAFAFNLLAGMVIGTGGFNIIKFFLGSLIFLAGHALNFASGLLSAYIHGSRLQYLEFFSKFYEGDGYLFEPLSYRFKYIKLLTNDGGK
jgi:V/A-type H+-transporting ATPase subunit I